MMHERTDVEAAIRALAEDTAVGRLVGAQSAFLVFDRSGERLLWSSPAATPVRDAIATGEGGRLDPARPLGRRLRALADGLAPRDGLRLERLRLGVDRLDAPVTCACRRFRLASGAEALLVAIAGPVPIPARRAQKAAVPAASDGASPAGPPGETAPQADRPRPVAPRGTVRFLWHADPEGCFTSVSEALAEVAGAGARVVGLRWSEIVARGLADDPGGAVAEAFAEARSWTGLVVEWRIGDGGRAVPVDLAGMPVRGRDGRLAGFRGFGLCRMDEIVDRPRAAQPEPTRREEPADQPGSFPDLQATVGGRLGAPPVPLRAPDPEAADEARPSEPQPPRTGPSLSFLERSAFREIARALGARFEEADPDSPESRRDETPGGERTVAAPARTAPPVAGDAERVLDRLPAGILIHRGDEPLFANRLFLDLVEYDDIGRLAEEGGVPRLFRGRAGPLARFEEAGPLALTTRRNGSVAVEVRLTTVEWDGLPASLMLVRKAPEAEQGQRLRALELDLRARDARLRELSAILDTATDGVLVLDDDGRILSLNRSAEALFGYDQNEVVGERFIVLLAPESHGAALGYIDGLRGEGVASLFNDGREVLARVRQGGTIPLSMTMGRLGEAPERRFCAVLRDITPFKKTEGELLSAKRAAEEGSAQKSDFLAKVSHEIRTPLNAIIGFAEVMLEERFGPVGNERYKDYLRDVHASGGHVISLVNDLLDLAKVEAGRMELAFASVRLNDLVAASVALMQPEAARERIVMRTSFAPKLPAVVADERSIRQIALNLISNAIRFTEAGGQVIVSTALTDRGEVAVRVRDTGLGMSPEDVTAALEPFRQLATARRGGGTGLGLPLTKALVEANRGALRITSARAEGTLVEVLFPPTRVLAD